MAVLLLVAAGLLAPRIQRVLVRNNDICNLMGTGDLGYIKREIPLQRPKTLHLAGPAEVYSIHDGKTARRCLLPHGSRVRVVPKHGKIWVAYSPENQLPLVPRLARIVVGAPDN